MIQGVYPPILLRVRVWKKGVPMLINGFLMGLDSKAEKSYPSGIADNSHDEALSMLKLP